MVKMIWQILGADLCLSLLSFSSKALADTRKNYLSLVSNVGLFCAPFFHLYAHDKSGFAGGWLRTLMSPLHGMFPDMDDKTFAVMLVSLFMQVVTILQLPSFLGPSFNPFTMIGDLIITPFAGSSSKSTSAAANLAKKAVAEREIKASEDDKLKKKNKRRTAGKSKRA